LAFNSQQLKTTIDQLFVHSMRMLCVLACVIDDTALPSNLTTNLSAGSTAVAAAPPPPQTSIPVAADQLNLTTNAANTTTGSSSSNNRSTSPNFIRSKFSSMTENNKNLKASSNSSTKESRRPSATSSISSQSESSSISQNLSDSSGIGSSSLPKTTTSVYLGFFQNSSYYLKLYETLKIAFNSYKKSPSINTYDRFTQIVKSTLRLFAQLLESALSVHEIGPHLDEILLYLKIIFSIEPSCSVKCVTLCLKSLFSLNMSGLMLEYLQQQMNKILNLNTPQSGSSQSTSLNSNISSSNLPTPIPLSGFSSVLSSSLTSIASNSQQQNSYSNMASWVNSSRRQETSLYSSLITNHLTQFTRFMYSQSIMFKSDNLIGIHFNTGNQLILPSI
jgi:hypothetical protein